jgi:hypothetical protein
MQSYPIDTTTMGVYINDKSLKDKATVGNGRLQYHTIGGNAPSIDSTVM